MARLSPTLPQSGYGVALLVGVSVNRGWFDGSRFVAEKATPGYVNNPENR
jgi:hypothetical protein